MPDEPAPDEPAPDEPAPDEPAPDEPAPDEPAAPLRAPSVEHAANAAAMSSAQADGQRSIRRVDGPEPALRLPIGRVLSLVR
jgi:hypothetical protein